MGAFPYFWLAMAALYVFGFELRLFPLRHAYTDGAVPAFRWDFLQDVARHAALPVLTLVLAGTGGWATGMRANMAAVLGSEALGLARLKGLSPVRLAVHYAARNALLPSLTGFGMALGFSLGGSMLTEVVFSYPGLGFLLVQAVRAQDYPLMQGLFLVVTLAVLAGNWAVDVATLRLDPRTRQGGEAP
jgi:peptide/nickel transport system permease protein